MVTRSSLPGWSLPVPGVMTLVARPEAVFDRVGRRRRHVGRRRNGRRRGRRLSRGERGDKDEGKSLKNAHRPILPVVSCAPYLAGFQRSRLKSQLSASEP